MVAAVVDEDDRQAVAVQVGEVAEGVLGLHDDEPVEGARRHLAGEALDGLGPAVAGEEQQPVVGGLDGVDDPLEQFAHPRPGQRGHEHPDRTAGAPGQTHGSGAGHIAELCDHFTNAGGGHPVHLALGVDDPRHGRLADAGLAGDIGDGDAHRGLQGPGDALERFPVPVPEPVPALRLELTAPIQSRQYFTSTLVGSHLPGGEGGLSVHLLNAREPPSPGRGGGSRDRAGRTPARSATPWARRPRAAGRRCTRPPAPARRRR